MNQGDAISRRACVRAPLITRGGMPISRAVPGGSGPQTNAAAVTATDSLLPPQNGSRFARSRGFRSPPMWTVFAISFVGFPGLRFLRTPDVRIAMRPVPIHLGRRWPPIGARLRRQRNFSAVLRAPRQQQRPRDAERHRLSRRGHGGPQPPVTELEAQPRPVDRSASASSGLAMGVRPDGWQIVHRAGVRRLPHRHQPALRISEVQRSIAAQIRRPPDCHHQQTACRHNATACAGQRAAARRRSDPRRDCSGLWRSPEEVSQGPTAERGLASPPPAPIAGRWLTGNDQRRLLREGRESPPSRSDRCALKLSAAI
jgi:hypothetical protein